MRKNRWITYPVFSSFARATLQGTTKSTGKAGRKHRSVVTRWMAKPASCPPTLLGHVPLVVTYANPHITEEWTGRAGEAEGQRHRAIHCSPIRTRKQRGQQTPHVTKQLRVNPEPLIQTTWIISLSSSEATASTSARVWGHKGSRPHLGDLVGTRTEGLCWSPDPRVMAFGDGTFGGS